MSAIRLFDRFKQLLDVNWSSIADGNLLKRDGASIIGTSGSYFPEGHLIGLTLSNNATDATNDIDIAAGSCRSSDNTADIILSSGLTKQLDVAWAAGTNQGGRSSSSLADGTWHVHVIKNLTTGAVDAFLATSPTAPTLPSGYTVFRRVASILREAGVNVAFSQYGDQFRRAVAIDYNSASARAMALLILSVPIGIRVYPYCYTNLIKGTVGDAYITVTDVFALPLSGHVVSRVAIANDRDQAWFNTIITNLSAQINMSVTIGSGTITEASIRTLGWHDNRGKDGYSP